jgi:uncharacterized membrane protein YfcA
MKIIILYIIIGLVVGSVSGMLGIGGGVLLVPALVWICRFEPVKAAGTSLAILIPPIGLPAALKAFKENRIDLEAALWIAGAFTVGAYLGASFVSRISDFTLRLMFGTLMIYVGVRFMIGATMETRYAGLALFSVLFAWLGHLWLRALGRRHLKTPGLAQEIRTLQEKGMGDFDYHI